MFGIKRFTVVCLILCALGQEAYSSGEIQKRGGIGLGRVTDRDCSSFLLTETAYLFRLSQDYGQEPWEGYYKNNNLNYYFSADAGWMKNLNNNAVGGTLCWSFDDKGSRLALKPRYRRWLSRTIHADASVGVIFLITGGWDNAGGLTGNIGIGIRDLVTVLVQYETIPYESFPRDAPSIKGTERTLYTGIKVGSFAGAATMIVTPVVVGIFWVIGIAESD